MERYTQFQEGNFYHVYNRGIDKRKIFFVKNDWNHFQRSMYIRNNTRERVTSDRLLAKSLYEIDREDTLTDICAYAMMTNHFHMLLHEKVEGGITKFMRKFLTAHSMYMNTKYNRSGPMMCRPFRAKYIDSDEYLRWLVSYIHANPLDKIEPGWKENGISNKREASKFLQNYKYSSYYDYFVNDREESLILNKEILPIKMNNLESVEDILQEVNKYDT